jgi:hypothetical protein
MRKAAGKCPAVEGPSQKKKFAGPLGMECRLNIDDKESNWK